MSAVSDSDIRAALRGEGLIDESDEMVVAPMIGGVSSEIWKVEAGGRVFCVKQALARLRVEAEWCAPVERNRFEVLWNQIAARVAPGSAPRVRCDDDERMFFIMDYLDPGSHELWKKKLMEGRADSRDAANVGHALSRIHSAVAGDADVARQFPRTDIFYDIRLEPYLLATGRRHRELAPRLEALCRTTARTRLTLIHGDVSPKNILIGPHGPVFLDAECASIGDPAFDIAFCLNHMLLKCLWRPDAAESYLGCFDALAEAYLSGVEWEERDMLEERAAALLPALFLARVDGKSPVEYITQEWDRDKIRRCASGLITRPPARLATITDAWRRELGQ
ncbi:MAG: phosphotransferase [Arenicellales bacterium]